MDKRSSIRVLIVALSADYLAPDLGSGIYFHFYLFSRVHDVAAHDRYYFTSPLLCLASSQPPLSPTQLGDATI